MASGQVDERDDRRDGRSERSQPQHDAARDENAVHLVRRTRLQPRAPRGVSDVDVMGHQQLVVQSLLFCDAIVWPSLLVIEQFNLLSLSRLDACTDPYSDIEIGCTVSDHGM